MKEIIVEQNEVLVQQEYDVIVVGGGIAGVSAALAAKRSGCNVLLIEKSIILGGLATLGLITFYEPMCDGKGRKIISGIAEELLHLSIKYGYNTLPEEWKSGDDYVPTTDRYNTIFSPSLFVVAMDEILEAEGIDILFDTLFCKPVMEGDWCKGVIVENKSGRSYYRAKVVIDATGDADVLERAGADCVLGDNWLSYYAYETDIDKMKKAVESKKVIFGTKGIMWGSDRLGRRNPEGMRKYNGTDAKDVTSFVLEGRKLVRQSFKDSNNDQRDLLMIPGMAQFRTTRRIKGLYELKEEDQFKHFDDSIGCICDFSKPGPIYEIPYRTLISKGINNIITAGRTIASVGHAWEVTRVIPAASLTGQAAGTAAASAIKNECSLHEIQVEKLQNELYKAKVMIHH